MPRCGRRAERRRSESCSTRRVDPGMPSFGLCCQWRGKGGGRSGVRRTKRNASANGLPGWIRPPTCRPDAVRFSAGRPNAGVDGCDQVILLAEKAFDTAYTLRSRLLRTVGFPLKNSAGRAEAIVLMTEDITERK